MNRRRAISSLLALPFSPFLGAFDHSCKHASPRILVACIGESGRRVFDVLIHDTSGLLQPMMVHSEAQVKSVVNAVSKRRVVFIGQLDTRFDGSLAWQMLKLVRKQPNCSHNFLAYVIYPYLRFEEMKVPLIPDKIPRWAYSTVDYVSVVSINTSDINNVQSRWQLRYFNTDVTKVEKQVARDIAKVQIQGTWR